MMIQIILIGQESLQDKLQSPSLEQLAQRIEAYHTLSALDADDTCAYIRHRLSKAGGSSRLFDDAACELVRQKSGGVPRLINRICDMALVFGYAANTQEITAEMVAAASREQLAEEPRTHTTSHDVAAKHETVAEASQQKTATMALPKEKHEDTATKEELAHYAKRYQHANQQLEKEQAQLEQLITEEKAATQAVTELEEAASEIRRRASEEETVLAQQLEQMQLAEEQAVAAAAAVAEAAEQALRERIALERVAAGISAKAEATVNRVRKELVETRSRIAEQTAELETAIKKADAEQQLASELARQKADELKAAKAATESAAQQTQQLKTARDKVAAALVTAEKLLAAEQADNLAQIARQEADRAAAAETRILEEENNSAPPASRIPQISQQDLAAATRLAAQARARRKQKRHWLLLAASIAGIALTSWVTMEVVHTVPVDNIAASTQTEAAALEIRRTIAPDAALSITPTRQPAPVYTNYVTTRHASQDVTQSVTDAVQPLTDTPQAVASSRPSLETPPVKAIIQQTRQADHKATAKKTSTRSTPVQLASPIKKQPPAKRPVKDTALSIEERRARVARLLAEQRNAVSAYEDDSEVTTPDLEERRARVARLLAEQRNSISAYEDNADVLPEN
jgi:hypothetical protein